MLNIELFGYKCGMTQFFAEDGTAIPVSVIKFYKNYIVDIKKEHGNKLRVKIAACPIKKKHTTKPLEGTYKKIGIENLKYTKEFITKDTYFDNYKVGDIIPISLLNKNNKINITGISKGKGFAGVIKRHNFKSQKASHGNSLSHRVPGSIGQCQDPGKVFKGKKMSGRLGGKRVTTKNISIIKTYNDIDAILLKGSIPGFIGNKIILKQIIQ